MTFYTKCVILFVAEAALLFFYSRALGQVINYDESKAGSYTLPDPLLLPDGKKITTTLQWTEQGRPGTLKLFKDNVYGQFPGKPGSMHFIVRNVDRTALGGLATRKQVTVFFINAPDAPSMELLLYLPNNTEGPVPAFAGLNFYGNQSVNADPGIIITNRWVKNNAAYGITNHKATESSRGMQASRWPVEELMKQGFALVTAYYGDLEPDYPAGWETGIRTSLKTELGIPENEWGAISAWSWGLSRMMDYLQTEPAINAKQIALTGHSRLGKAALWAGANDTRFALIISNESGEGGAALARRNYGETIEKINLSFPHWFSPVYKTYNQQPHNLPVDQHQLLALIAPRPLYVCSAVEDRWSDPKGEFLGAFHAGPIYQLYNKASLSTNIMPPVEQPTGETLRYHIRNGAHGITIYDWKQHIAFAKKQFNLYSLTVLTNGSGSVTRNPNQVNYTSGTSITLTATPATGYKFSGWSGAATGTTNPLTVIMTGNKSITANFTLVIGQQVASFTLINATTDQPIRNLVSGDVINIAAIKNLNIRANTNPLKVGSVKFNLSGKQIKNSTENTAPYALFGDNNGNYNSWTPAIGSYTLSATPYSGASGSGTASTPLTISFSVINQAIATNNTARLAKAPELAGDPVQLMAYPTPTSDGRLQVSLTGNLEGELIYTLVSALGERLGSDTLILAEPTPVIAFDFSQQMRVAGVYYLLLEGKNLKVRLKLMQQ